MKHATNRRNETVLRTLVLNADYTPFSIIPLSVCRWYDALRLYLSERMDVIDYHEGKYVRTVKNSFPVPSIVVMRRYVRRRWKPPLTRYNLFLRDGFTCVYCGSEDLTLKTLTVDHVVPRSRGDKHIWSNIITSCMTCNVKKSNKIPFHKYNRQAIEPSYGYLVSKRKKYPLVVNSLYWNIYLEWPEDNLILRKGRLFV